MLSYDRFNTLKMLQYFLMLTIQIWSVPLLLDFFPQRESGEEFVFFAFQIKKKKYKKGKDTH